MPVSPEKLIKLSILTPEFLHKEYVELKKTICQICRETGCSRTAIKNRLNKLEIKINSKPHFKGISKEDYRVINKLRYELNKEEVLTKVHEYRNTEQGKKQIKDYNNSEKAEKCRLKYKAKGGRDPYKRYGSSKAEYDSFYTLQNGCCYMCKRHSSEFKKKLYLDHDHKTNVARGLLCQKCNCVLGFADDKIAILQAGVEFLTIHSKKVLI